jgi:hypothetical protein
MPVASTMIQIEGSFLDLRYSVGRDPLADDVAEN